MRIAHLLFLLVLPFSGCAQSKYNINGEEINRDSKMPENWKFFFSKNQTDAYTVKLDSLQKQEGKYSFSIENIGKQAEFGVFDYPIKQTFEGKDIELRGYIKTKDVQSGYAALWLRLDGTTNMIGLDNMSKNGVKGTTDWKEYILKLPYDDKLTKSIHLGGMLIGSGKAWFDGFRLFINGKPVEQAVKKDFYDIKADLDTAFNKTSGIGEISMSPQIVSNLSVTGQFWAFLKYHHPAIAKGDYNWDAELFRLLPEVIKSKDNKAVNKALEAYLDRLPITLSDKKNTAFSEQQIALKPDYGQLFDGSILSKTLTDKLINIRNTPASAEHYYISMDPQIGNPIFKNERPYAQMTYPDAGYRLLSLYRYWAIINYFFPYKNQIGTDWNKELTAAIPAFVAAKNEEEYTLNVLKIIARIHDTHANIWGGNAVINKINGKEWAPFKAKFIENKLVVTGYILDTLDVKNKFKVGDVITAINGKAVPELIKALLPRTPASNYDTQLRDLPNYLLKGHTKSFSFNIQRNGKTFVETIGSAAESVVPYKPYPGKTAYSLLNEEIGYVFPGKYKNSDLPEIKKLFKTTKGIIIDMRCYPSEFMPFTFGNYLKSSSSPFVTFSRGSIAQPGLFLYSPPLSNGALEIDYYQGKVVVIVNADSQSQAEYTTMAFQSTPNVKVIGSTTAGADGNVSPFKLPGGITTMISGIGVFYPDRTPTQRVGVKIDKVIRPTIKGIAAGKDELLDKAIEMILQPGS
jgi:C-terminal processing protease CtpA/Prc